MYEDDTPPAERRAQALSLDRDLLRELLGQEELRDLLDPDALAEVERQLRGEPRDPDELHDLLRLPRRPARGRVRRRRSPSRCSRERRALLVRVAGEERADRGRGRGPLPRRARRDAAGRAARGVPRGGAGRAAPARCSATRRPRARSRPPRRASASGRDVEAELRGARARRAARPRRAAAGRHRARVVRPRRPAPAPPRVARGAPARGRAGRAGRARALPARLARHRPARDAARGARARCRRSPLPVPLWETEVLPRRVPGYQPAQLDAALRDRRGRLGRRRARPRRRLLPRGRAAARPPAGAPPPESAERTTRSARRSAASALFWSDLLAATGLEPRRRCPRSGSSSGRAR